MKKHTIIALITISVLTGCAKSTTQSDFECTASDGVAPCLTTEQVDVMGDIPKGSTGNADIDAESVLKVKNDSPLIPDSLEKESSTALDSVQNTLPFTAKTIEVQTDRTYPIKPLINEPIRQFGSTERMWFAAWEDKNNDLFIDQQYIYWTEKGRWALLED